MKAVVVRDRSCCSRLAACGADRRAKPAAPPPPPVDLRGRSGRRGRRRVDNAFTPPSIIVEPRHQGDVAKQRSGRAQRAQERPTRSTSAAPFGVDTADFGPGASYSFTFAKPGTYTYTCTIHTLMDGTVQVA